MYFFKISKTSMREGSYKVKKELVQYATNRIKEKPDIFIKDLLEDVKGKFPDITLSRQHLGRILRNDNKTRKRLRHIYTNLLHIGENQEIIIRK